MNMKTVLTVLGVIAAIFAGFVALMALVFALLFAISPLKTVQCEGFAEKAGYTSSYQWYSNTCFLEIDGKWIPKSVWVNNTGN